LGAYDEWHHDHHRWDDNEEIVLRGYLTDNHKDYHPYKELSRDDQKAYWDWRQNHSDMERSVGKVGCFAIRKRNEWPSLLAKT
jgi:hypothetical protein